MSEKNVVEQINSQIDAILKERGSELAKTLASIRDTRSAIDEQEDAIRAAIAEGNMKTYTAASEKKSLLERQLEMYTRRKSYFEDNAGITDTDTENTIDRIFEYESEEEKELVNAIRGPLKQLEEINRTYRERVLAAENTIKRWTASIRPNYRSANTTFRETGTNHSLTPIPVRSVPFLGCDLSEKILRWMSYPEIKEIIETEDNNV